MQHESKFFVYLQRLSHKHETETPSVTRRATGIFYAQSVRDIHAVCEPRDLLVMGTSVSCNDLSSGKWHTAFFVPRRLIVTQMKHTNKTAGETAQSITFKADWLDFTEHLSNAHR